MKTFFIVLIIFALALFIYSKGVSIDAFLDKSLQKIKTLLPGFQKASSNFIKEMKQNIKESAVEK